jgi:integrase/recombinase XerC
VNAYGKKVLGTALHPPALRHMAITAYLDMSDGDVRGAQRLSRHVNLLTLQVYDYNRSDLQGKATAMLSTLFGETS